MSVKDIKKDLAGQALAKAQSLRKKLQLDPKSPICIYEICERLELTVQFIPLLGLEGMYLNRENRILISSLRPIYRKKYTCAHELGHHIFGHGSKMDDLKAEQNHLKFLPEEFLVDCFAGFLLMPKIALLSAFSSRNWSPESATAIQYYTISCSFNVGYTTLINHMLYMHMISEVKANELNKLSPKTIRHELLGDASINPLVIADEKWMLKTIDVEVDCKMILPKTAIFDLNSQIISCGTDITEGRVVTAQRAGLVRVFCPDNNWAVFVRISRLGYEGLNQYKHMEEIDDE